MGVDNEIFWSEIALGSPPRFPKNTPPGEEGKKKGAGASNARYGR